MGSNPIVTAKYKFFEKGILEFDRNATIGEINHEDNLVWLCPNHHKMLEMGLIKLE